ncbi:MAG: DsbE family thiol:disulfide interchange protein [Pseudomonadota bacterium]
MAKISPFVLAPPLIFAALAGLFYAGMLREDPDALPFAQTGEPAPQMLLQPLGTKPSFSDQDLTQDGVKLVNYWASWCAPCRAEHPTLMQLAEEGIPIYGINYKDRPDQALGFLEELGDPYAGVGADPSGRTALDWGLYGVPETYVIDGEGRVVLRFAGPVTQRVLEDRIRPALQAAEAGRPES